MWKHLRVLLALAFLTLGLSGCTLSGVMQAVGQANSGTPPVIYDLIAPRQTGGRRRMRDWQLIVKAPEALRPLETRRILAKPNPHEVAYFPAAEWSDKLPRLLQMRLIETFQNARILRGVSNGRDRIAGDLALKLELRRFQVDVEASPIARVSIHASMVHIGSGDVIGERLFSASEATQDDAASAVANLNSVFGRVANKLVHWAVQFKATKSDSQSE